MKKKFLLILIIALTATATFCQAKDSGKKVPRKAINSLVNEFRHYDEFECLNLGKFMTSVIRKVGALSLYDDDMDAQEREEAKVALSALKSVKGMTIVDYEDCEMEVRQRFNQKMTHLLEGVELLMSAKDEDESVYLYGYVTGDGAKVRDLVIFSPEDGSMICIYGTIDMEKIGALASVAE